MAQGRRRPAPGATPAGSEPLAVEDLGLLDGELLVGEHALLVQPGEVLELCDRVHRGRGRRGRRRGLRVLLLLGLVVGALLLPAIRLPAGYAVAHRRRRAGDDGGAGDAAKQSGHGSSPLVRWWLPSRPGTRGQPGWGCGRWPRAGRRSAAARPRRGRPRCSPTRA